ncbi:Pre-mRNA branch site protein p14 [Trichinella pseudospiralis]|uniref:Splicing factor 3B subunit 6 n=1 Tax=Trichinella pseudospiralis TaxID=6337 RepID=A0A0V1FTF5_TRIPS|nr:Pre-mRNA branch site protein p14 [Trichinella pseudospiralis]
MFIICKHKLRNVYLPVYICHLEQQNFTLPILSVCSVIFKLYILSRVINYVFKKATMAMGRKANVRLPPEVNRILYVKNLPYKITGEEMYDIFGKYGAIRQIRVGNTPETRGTAFVVYEDIFDAKNACDHLSGFNVCNRYLVVLYYQANKAYLRMDTEKSKKELERVKAKYGLGEFNCSSHSSGNFADLNEVCCAYYYTCNNGEAKRTSCPDGLYYDKKSKTCKDKEEIAECNICYLNKNENVSLSACSSAYIFCHNTIPIRQWCFANEVFDIRTRLCTSRDKASGCLSNEFQFKNVHGLDNLCSEYDRQFKQMKEIQSCLPFFIECSNDNVRIMQCRESETVFDDFYKTCVPKDLSFTCFALDTKVNVLNGKEEKSGCSEKMFNRKRRMLLTSNYAMHPLYGSVFKKANNSETISMHPNGASEVFDLTKAVVKDKESDRLKKALSNTDINVQRLNYLKNVQQRNGYRFMQSNFDDEIFSADLHAKMANADLADAQFPSRPQFGNDWDNKEILIAPKTDVNEICEMIRKSCESEQHSPGYDSTVTDETNDKKTEKCNVEVTKCLQSLKSDNSTMFQQYHFPFRKLLNKLCKNGDVKFAVAPCSRFYVHCSEGAYVLKSCLEKLSYNAQTGQCMPCTVSASATTVVTTPETIKCAGNFEILKDGIYEERTCGHRTESSTKVFGQVCICQAGYLRLSSESGSLCVSENYCRMHKVAMAENKFCSGRKADFSSLVDCNEVYYRCQRNRTNFFFCNQGHVFDLAKGRCVLRQLCSRKIKPILTHLNDLCIGRKDGAYSLITNLSYPTFYMCSYEMIVFSSCERGSLFDWTRKICTPMKTQDCTDGIQPKGHFEAGYSICWGGMIYETACSDGMVLKEVTDHEKVGYVCVEKENFFNHQDYPKSCHGKSDGFYLNLTSEAYFFCANNFATYLNGENSFSFDCNESNFSASNDSISCEVSYKLTNLTSFIKRLKAEQSQSFEVAPCEANYLTKKNSAMILEKCAAGEVFVSIFQRCMKMSTDGRCTKRILCNGKVDAIYPILPCHAKYYVCFGGYRYEENCPPGKVFSMHHQSCIAFLNDPSCHWNSSSLLLPAKHCSEFGNCHPVYQNCIIEGQIMNIACDDGNVYDISLKQCVRKADCSVESYTFTTVSSLSSAGAGHASTSPTMVGSTVNFEMSPVTDSTEWISDDVAKISHACMNKPNGSYPIKGNCKQFLLCSNEISYVMECPANTVYNAKISNCGHPEDVPDCQSYVANEKLTRDVSRAASWMKTFCADKADGYYRHFNRCDQFIQCLKRRKIILSCTKGLVFNPTMKVCDLPRRVPECNIILNNLVEKESTPDDYCKGIEHGAFTKDPNSCSRFYRCVHGKAHRFDCPPNLVFNPKLNTCDWLSNVSGCAV